jgi:tetratricopeptide (TPR) repeat protein
MKRALLITLFVVITASFAAFCPLRAQDAVAWTDFQQKAAAWRALPVKPALSDDVKRERLLAENAVSEKRFQDAVNHYEAGLKLNPMWPEGHFNAALVSAELTNYDKAVWHMRAYVELAPNAPDTEEARNQIIIWQDKLKLKLEATLTWTDSTTGLMWTNKENGGDVNWQQATDYCKNLQLAGHTDWRLPTIDELQGIYDRNANVGGAHVKGNLQVSRFQWSSSPGKASVEEWSFAFFSGTRHSLRLGQGWLRSLCVRRSGE